MRTVNHRLEHLGESLGSRLKGLLLTTFTGFSASWDRLMERNTTTEPGPAAADDILWDDGEPTEPADRV